MAETETGKLTPAGDDPRPVPPPEPDPEECCGSGCVPCVYDYYDEARGAYREALAAWLQRHPEADGSKP